MNDDDLIPDDDPIPHLRFDKLTRDRLTKDLKESWKDVIPDDFTFELDFEVSVMIAILEGLAEVILMHKKMQCKHETQQRRIERVESLAAHLEGAIEQIKQLDDAALGYVLYRAFEEVSRDKGEKNQLSPGMEAVFMAGFLRDEHIKELCSFSAGVRLASCSLPKLTYRAKGDDQPGYALSAELSAALVVERQFWERKLAFSVSNAGLAAKCLRAVYSLAGLPIDRVDNWLRKARDHHDSMTSYMTLRQKFKEE